MTDTSTHPEFAITDSRCYVKIRYRVRVVEGPILKGADEPEVMDFVTGFAQVIPGLETRLLGRCQGEKLSFTVPAEEAFGPRHSELVFEKSKADFHFPAGFEPYPGMELPFICESEGAPDTVRIKEIRDTGIVIDCNHPLAGAALEYDLEIEEARPAKETDVCANWEESSCQSDCSTCSPHEIVLGGDSSKDEPLQ